MTDQLFQTALAENGATAVTPLEAKYCPSLAAASRVRGVSQDKTKLHDWMFVYVEQQLAVCVSHLFYGGG